MSPLRALAGLRTDRRPASAAEPVGIVLLAIVLGIAIVTVLAVFGLGGASATPPKPCQHDKGICRRF